MENMYHSAKKKKLNLTVNWSTTINTPQSNWWPFMSHSISDGARNAAIGLFFNIVYPSFHISSDTVGAMQGDTRSTSFLQH